MTASPFTPLDAAAAEAVAGGLAYDDRGLVPAIAQSRETGAVLMMAWMNRQAVVATLTTGRVTYWSRSRGALWAKGESSGNTQRLVRFRVDCDSDTILATVDQAGPACHTGAPTCFFTEVTAAGMKPAATGG